jgi:hypothetical protein
MKQEEPSQMTYEQQVHAVLQQKADRLREDLTPEEKEKALKIGRIEFKSAGAVRKR